MNASLAPVVEHRELGPFAKLDDWRDRIACETSELYADVITDGPYHTW